MRRNPIARLLLKKEKEETVHFRPTSAVRIDTLVIEITWMFTSTTRTSSFTNARSCCLDASMNHGVRRGRRATATGGGRGGGEREKGARGERGKGWRVTGKLEKYAPISMHSSFRREHSSLFTLLLTESALARECCAILLGKSVRVKSEILFLETVPARYYLLAVFQKKHRRRRRRRSLAGLVSGYLPSSRPFPPFFFPPGRPTSVRYC